MDPYQVFQRNMRFIERSFKCLLTALGVTVICCQFVMVLSCVDETSSYLFDVRKSSKVTTPANTITDITRVKVGFYRLCVSLVSSTKPTCLNSAGKTAQIIFEELALPASNDGKEPLELIFALTLQNDILKRGIISTALPLFLVGSFLLSALIYCTPRQHRSRRFYSENPRLVKIVCTTAFLSFAFVQMSSVFSVLAALNFSTSGSTIEDLRPWHPEGSYIVRASNFAKRCLWVIFISTLLFSLIQWMVLYEGICPSISNITRSTKPPFANMHQALLESYELESADVECQSLVEMEAQPGRVLSSRLSGETLTHFHERARSTALRPIPSTGSTASRRLRSDSWGSSVDITTLHDFN